MGQLKCLIMLMLLFAVEFRKSKATKEFFEAFVHLIAQISMKIDNV